MPYASDLRELARTAVAAGNVVDPVTGGWGKVIVDPDNTGPRRSRT